MHKELPMNTLVRIVNRNSQETIYYEDTTILKVVGKTFLPMAYGYTEVKYTLMNTEEETILEKAYTIHDIEELPRCTICGSYIEGDTCQDEEENIICEDCLIQRIAERKGLIS